MPKVALGPILIVGLGPGFTSIIAMGTVISIIITTIVVYTSFREVDPNYLKVMQTFGATRGRCSKKSSSRLLSDHHFHFESECRLILGRGHRGEFLVSAKGLGYMIIYGFKSSTSPSCSYHSL